jgi:hypothetical protein
LAFPCERTAALKAAFSGGGKCATMRASWPSFIAKVAASTASGSAATVIAPLASRRTTRRHSTF